MANDVICLEDPAFYKLIDKVVAYIKSTNPNNDSEFITAAQAMEILGCGKTKFNELKQAGEFIFYPPTGKSMFLKKSILEYQQRSLKK